LKPLLSAATPDGRIDAARRFLESIRRIGVRFTGQEELLALAWSRIDRGDIEGDHAILLAIAVADHAVFDEMRPSFDETYAWSDEAAPYQRFFAYESFIPDAVARVLAERHPDYRHVLIGVPAHVQALAEHSTGAGMLTPDLAYWADSPKPLPPCSVPRQVFYASLLCCGVDPLAGRGGAERSPRSDPWPRHVKKSARLVAWLARRRPDAGGILKRTAQHWGTLMAEEAVDEARPAILMSSGSAANESVILSLSRLTGGSAFVDPGFYFENFRSITDRRFTGRIATRIGLGETFFLCLEPITFCHPLDEGARSESILPLVDEILQLARSAPDRRHHLVIDVTAAPAMRLRAMIATPLPANVVLYKTCSITKHQDGSRNYSCGAVTISTADETLRMCLEADLREACKEVGGEVGPIHALNIPRTTRRSIEEKRARIAFLNHAVARGLDQSSGGRIVAYTYHSFLLPSREVIKRLASETLALVLAGGLRSRRDFERIAGPHLHERNRALAAQLQEIEYGNSFALPRSRLISQNCPALDVCPGFRVSVCVFRLCPGYEADEQRLIAEARLAIETLEESFAQLVDMARSLREKVVQQWILHG
jgi:hypothetical protein